MYIISDIIQPSPTVLISVTFYQVYGRLDIPHVNSKYHLFIKRTNNLVTEFQ